MLLKRESNIKGETGVSGSAQSFKAKGRPNKLAFLSNAWVLVA